MITVETTEDRILFTMKGDRDQIIHELAYAAAEFHFEFFRRVDGFDPATDKRLMIDTSCEGFCQLLRSVMDERYESHYSGKRRFVHGQEARMS